MPLPSSFHAAVRLWFDRTYAAPTAAQLRGWDEIRAGRDTLIAAPTGSGKTLAAFLVGLDTVIQRDQHAPAADAIEVVYVSPLKALSSDVQRNLASPLAGIQEAAATLGLPRPVVRIALRTGDTTATGRAAIVRDPPHVLVTTPESLYLMLTASRSRALLEGVRTVIVDELHALMRDKRGSHLALSLARLDAVARARPQRIGLSATVHPIEEAARFLVGGLPSRPCAIVDTGHRRDLDIAIEVPGTDLEAIATHEQWAEIYDRLATLVGQNRTTLVFVNTRRMAERVAHHLGERLGEERVGAHHGSLAKERRLRIEQRLKAGEMRALVATASLELGIDIGTVDLVCQVGSPRAVTTFLQRIGRSGHALGRTSCGRLFATSRDELVECAALVRAVAVGQLDRVEPPKAPLDILSQQIVAECSAREWNEDALYAVVRTAAPFAELPRADYDRVVATLADGAAPGLGRAGALLHHDKVNGALRGRRGARLVALTNGGAIPELADYRVLLDPDETLVGTVNEDWAIESMAGDVFILGSHSWRIRRVESRAGVLRVEDAKGQPPTVPFWLGEAPSRTWELSHEVARLRKDIATRLELPGASRAGTAPAIAAECALSPAGAEQLVDYIAAQRDALGIVPTTDDVVFERFFDEAGGMQLVVHAPFGGRVNRAFGLALRKRFCTRFDFELQAAATDDAVVLSMSAAHSFPLSDAFHFVRSEHVEPTLRQAVLQAPMFGTRWRWNVSRALAVLRFQRGKKVPAFLQRMRADDLLSAVFPAQTACQDNAPGGPIEIPDHPLVDQSVRDCLVEAMDLERLRGVLERIERGEIRVHARDTTEPSPFSHEILNAKPYAYLDDAPLEERRARAVSLRRTLPETQRDLAALDPDAIARVVAEARPAPRDADELHDVLLGLVATPVGLGVKPAFCPADTAGASPLLHGVSGPIEEWLADLVRAGRAIRHAHFVFATENARLVQALWPHVRLPLLPARLDGPVPPREAAVLAVVRGHADVLGPFTSAALARAIGVEDWEIEAAAARLESEGLLLRGRFTNAGGAQDEFCNRRLLARIHRYTLDRLRSEIEPVSAQDFLRFLFERHGLATGARAGGRAGLRSAIALLQGFEVAAAAWERDVLAVRIAGYRSEWLDELCFAGEVAWARLSPSKSASAASASTSRATPIALVFRRDLGWMLEAVRGGQPPESPLGGAAAAAVLEVLRRRGALFLEDLSAAARLSRAELTEALWDLVGRGLVASDAVQPLRDLMASGRAGRAGHAVHGRWALIEAPEVTTPADELADRVAGQLLARYGVVLREAVVRESFAVPWRDVLRALRRREARGLVRGGRFVSGFIGEQYALPEAVDALRRTRRTARSGEPLRIGAADPLNLVGLILPGARVPANHGSWLTFRDGAFECAEQRAVAAG
jgi:ATP-dependent Lhr-like helicase